MKKFFFILTLLLTASSCDYREYPQEQEWREENKKPVQEMNREKEKDPRNFDDELEKEEEQREVNVREINLTPANN